MTVLILFLLSVYTSGSALYIIDGVTVTNTQSSLSFTFITNSDEASYECIVTTTTNEQASATIIINVIGNQSNTNTVTRYRL